MHRTSFVLAIAASLPAALTTTTAFAHAQLRQASPAVGATVTAAPAQVQLTFSEGVEPRFSTIVVTGPGDTQVDQQDLHVVDGDAKRVAVSLGALRPGAYRVTWHSTSVDTHKTEGSFTFKVAP